MKDRNPSGRDTTGTHGCSKNDDDRFLNDSLLPAFYRNDQNDYFSLGLVVNWPNSRTFQSSTPPAYYNATNYERFLSAVKTECFRGRNDFLFCLPFHALHITVATLFPARRTSELLPRHAESTTPREAVATTKRTDGNTGSVGDGRRRRLATEWKKVLLRASSSDDWPRRPLKLQLDSAQIGNRAGILLWKEHTGGIAKMRSCLRAAANEEDPSSDLVRDHLRIPDIIHTTFLRYHQEGEGPETPLRCTTGDPDPLSWRPSQAHSVLIERVVPSQALFSTSSDTKTGDGAERHREFGTVNNDGSSGNEVEPVVASVASLVDCKIYLLGRREQDHEIYLSLPLRGSALA